MTMTCDRCKKDFDGDKIEDVATMGYYGVKPTGPWARFANPGENIVCDYCMWSDPRYIAVHGNLLA